MIYAFIWEWYFRKKKISAWREHFREKYDENNLFHINNIFDVEIPFFQNNLLTSGLFSSKKLCIIDDFPFDIVSSSWKDSPYTLSQIQEIQKYQDFFEEFLDKVDDDLILVFNSQKIDKRSKLFKKIAKIGEVTDFEVKNEADLYAKLKQEYQERVAPQVYKKMYELKWLNFTLIAQEFEKLFITQDRIELEDISRINKDVEESIFEIINHILYKKPLLAIEKMKPLMYTTDNPYVFYNMFIAVLRTNLYINLLKKLWISPAQITQKLRLWNRAFLATQSYPVTPDEFLKLYDNLSSLDAKMKKWNFISNDMEWFLYEIETQLIL